MMAQQLSFLSPMTISALPTCWVNESRHRRPSTGAKISSDTGNQELNIGH